MVRNTVLYFISNTVDGGWSSWGVFSDCSVTCGFGTMTQERKCNNPAPSGSGLDCVGDSIMTHVCKNINCLGNQNAYTYRWICYILANIILSC